MRRPDNMAQAPIPLTHGKNGGSPFSSFHIGLNSLQEGMLSAVAQLNGRVFDDDPVVAYMLLDLPQQERLDYLPTYWSTLVRSALLNDALITEADGWKAASVLIPPGKYIDNIWTLLYSGFFCVLWKIGFSGFKVGLARRENAGVRSTKLSVLSGFGQNSQA